MPKVLNKKTDFIPEDAVYIGRPSIFGNPFVIGVDGNRNEVIEKYRRHIALNIGLRKQIMTELKDKDLVCWCSPKPCHGDVLLEIANEPSLDDLFT